MIAKIQQTSKNDRENSTNFNQRPRKFNQPQSNISKNHLQNKSQQNSQSNKLQSKPPKTKMTRFYEPLLFSFFMSNRNPSKLIKKAIGVRQNMRSVIKEARETL
jgi:hypothetical protein